ncbi:hypothetical protein CA236_12995 [Sphingomonas sp. ABOLG]|jgi:hypothetical protein|uniref:Uncharacterized protein n=1 Tax=Sphingomonas olei TaxID=1886787 RepID=A0ABY2QE03_9SPHN|nr:MULTISPECIES: hypothetical protein [Sphingomonas]KKI18541.1 hypothetical protein XM50_12145 [Sphingomonas sp. Ag1]MDF2604708.1 hypothetical protein [Sphingomonas sp.]RSV16558.1 hypothetical protein CA236_12995 [Sphingomonas sp. ABOLG]THG38461.1 hypothetical protein E5988_14210 [Sphingomonas olei]
MAEATWGEATPPPIDWKMSASLENVPRGDAAVPEVTSLETAVRAWQDLDPAMRADAVLKLERPVWLIPEMPLDRFEGDGIGDLVRVLPA